MSQEPEAPSSPTPGAPDAEPDNGVQDFWDAIDVEIQCIQRDTLVSNAKFSRFALEQEMLNKVDRKKRKDEKKKKGKKEKKKKKKKQSLPILPA
jgi:hypothetical protein